MENTDETFDKHIPRLDVDVVEEWNLAKCVPKPLQEQPGGWLLRYELTGEY